jgi:hypothetical protein
MPTVIVPVGLNLGPAYPPEPPPNLIPVSYRVRLGREYEPLTAKEYIVWSTAFDNPERHVQHEVTRATLHRDVVASGYQADTIDGVIDALLGRGLLVEFDPHGPLEQTFRALRLYPLAQGLGNSSEHPEWWGIGHNGQAVLKVPGSAYGMWAFSHTEKSLWAACLYLAEDPDNELRPEDDVDDLTAEEAAESIAVTIPLLVSAGCAVLDKAG